MQDKREPQENNHQHDEKNSDDNSIETHDISKSFFSGISSKILPLENKKIVGIIDIFMIDLCNQLTSFLGKQINIEFESVKFHSAEANNIEKRGVVLSSFQMSSLNQQGLIRFDLSFMHYIMDILFGAKSSPECPIISRLGKSGPKIAEKISSIVIASFQSTLTEHVQLDLKHLLTTDHPSSIINKHLPDYYFELSFKIYFNDVTSNFSIIVPEILFEEITQQDCIEKDGPRSKSKSSVEDTLKNEIIDSSISLIACLQGITLKIKAIMELKSGDLIPINDPNIVFLIHNEKKLFKGAAGQSNNKRVVKIEDTA